MGFIVKRRRVGAEVSANAELSHPKRVQSGGLSLGSAKIVTRGMGRG